MTFEAPTSWLSPRRKINIACVRSKHTAHIVASRQQIGRARTRRRKCEWTGKAHDYN
jgi:hypothetical protein